jgi:hypothetical protein
VPVRPKNNVTEYSSFFEDKKRVGEYAVVAEKNLRGVGRFWKGLGLNPEYFIQVVVLEWSNHRLGISCVKSFLGDL